MHRCTSCSAEELFKNKNTCNLRATGNNNCYDTNHIHNCYSEHQGYAMFYLERLKLLLFPDKVFVFTLSLPFTSLYRHALLSYVTYCCFFLVYPLYFYQHVLCIICPMAAFLLKLNKERFKFLHLSVLCNIAIAHHKKDITEKEEITSQSQTLRIL